MFTGCKTIELMKVNVSKTDSIALFSKNGELIVKIVPGGAIKKTIKGRVEIEFHEKRDDGL